MTFVPLVNSDNIQLLTSQNWLDLNIKTLAFSLEALLMKPGLAVLLNQPSLAAFLGWPHEVWLITSALQADKKLKLRSPFDGSISEYTQTELEQLIASLKPVKVYTLEQLPQLNISEEPLTMARLAQAYDAETTLQLTDSVFRDQYLPLQTACACPTCQIQLTRAYLHHLWPEVPALCQRYLAMHNIWVRERAV
jgi:hypothetical protein